MLLIKYCIGIFFSLGIGIYIFIIQRKKSLYSAILGLIIGILASIIFFGQVISIIRGV